MALVKEKKTFSCLQWTLLIIFVIYWLIFFPIIWFVVQPASFQTSTSATLLYALLFFAVFIVLYCIIYCCFKRCEQNRTKKRYVTRVKETYVLRESVDERPESMKMAFVSRKDRPASKRVLIPKVPEAENNEGVRYITGDSNRDSTITIPLYVEDSGEDKTKFVTKQELYFDGAEFLDKERTSEARD